MPSAASWGAQPTGDPPVPDAQPRQGPGGVGAARAVRSRSLSPRRRGCSREHRSLQTHPGHRRAPLCSTTHRGSVARRRDARGPALRCDAGRHHDGHVPAGRIHIGTERDLAGGRAGERRDASGRAARARGLWSPIQDRHAAAHRWSHRRLFGVIAGRRARSSSSTIRGRTSGTIAAPHRRTHDRHPRRCPAGSRTTVRRGSDHRGQHRRVGDVRRRESGRAVRGTARRSRTRSSGSPTRSAISCSRARGARHSRAVRQRTVDVAAGDGAARDAADGSRSRAGAE